MFYFNIKYIIVHVTCNIYIYEVTYISNGFNLETNKNLIFTKTNYGLQILYQKQRLILKKVNVIFYWKSLKMANVRNCEHVHTFYVSCSTWQVLLCGGSSAIIFPLHVTYPLSVFYIDVYSILMTVSCYLSLNTNKNNKSSWKKADLCSLFIPHISTCTCIYVYSPHKYV